MDIVLSLHVGLAHLGHEDLLQPREKKTSHNATVGRGTCSQNMTVELSGVAALAGALATKPQLGFICATIADTSVAKKQRPVPPGRKRAVHFRLEANTVFDSSLSHDDIIESWLTMDDEDDFKCELFACVQAARSSRLQAHVCTRGLEHLVSASLNHERNWSVQAARQVVIQEGKHCASGSTELANVYAHLSASNVLYAMRMGIQDMISAMDVHFEQNTVNSESMVETSPLDDATPRPNKRKWANIQS